MVIVGWIQSSWKYEVVISDHFSGSMRHRSRNDLRSQGEDSCLLSLPGCVVSLLKSIKVLLAVTCDSSPIITVSRHPTKWRDLFRWVPESRFHPHTLSNFFVGGFQQVAWRVVFCSSSFFFLCLSFSFHGADDFQWLKVWASDALAGL